VVVWLLGIVIGELIEATTGLSIANPKERSVSQLGLGAIERIQVHSNSVSMSIQAIFYGIVAASSTQESSPMALYLETCN
jgi:hypothetical protein